MSVPWVTFFKNSSRNFDLSINMALVNGCYLHFSEMKKFLKKSSSLKPLVRFWNHFIETFLWWLFSKIVRKVFVYPETCLWWMEATCTIRKWRNSYSFLKPPKNGNDPLKNLAERSTAILAFLFHEPLDWWVDRSWSTLYVEETRGPQTGRYGLTVSQTTNFRTFQTERIDRRKFKSLWKWQKILMRGGKHCGGKEKLLVMSNFSFSHSVFKRPVLQTSKNQGLYGKCF